ncbi:MAG TPA: hypothetical protein VK390_07065 [Propionibacteriaceae bacterium]|nr:hypothetical protein [Propionibacteriaceae bacterium]
MANRNGYHLDIRERHWTPRAHFFPQTGWYIRRARRATCAQHSRTLHDKTGEFADVVAVFMADQQRVYIRHAEPDTVQRTQQPPYANPAVDQQDSS